MEGCHVITELAPTLCHKMTHATPERYVSQVCSQVNLENVTGQEVFFTDLKQNRKQ